MEVKGRIKVINEAVQVSEKFRKRDFVLTINEETQYPQFIPMQFSQDKCDLLNGFNVGDVVNVGINLQGREYNGKNGIQYFLTLSAWKIAKS